MKRFFFTVIALAAVAVSCTKSGVLESPQTYQDQITFEPYTGKAPVTKATVADDATLRGGFRVIGFNAASNGSIADPTQKPYLSKMVTGTLKTVNVKDADGNDVIENGETKTEQITEWSYTGAMFWPDKADDKLSFVAYGLNVNGTPVVNQTAGESYGDVTIGQSDIFAQGTNYATFTYKVPDARTDQKDLLISPVNSGDNGRTVAMRLYHVLSRIGFSVDVQNATTGTTKPEVEITSIDLTGSFIETATFNLAEAVTVSSNEVTYKRGGSEATKTYTFYGTDETTFKTSTTGKQAIHTGNENDRYMMIVPGQGTEIIVKYKIGGVQQKDAKLTLTTPFEAGKAYEFVFTLSTVEVGFNVNVTDWDTDHNDASKDYPLN